MKDREPSNASRRSVLRATALTLGVAVAGCSSTDADPAAGSADQATSDTGESQTMNTEEDDATTAEPTPTERSTTTADPDLPVENENSGEGYESVQTAIDEASAGDTLLVREGTHNEGHIILVNKPLRIRGEDGAVVTWAGGTGRLGSVPHGNEAVDQTIFLVRANDVTVENLVLDGQSHHKSEDGYAENVNETSYGIAVMDGPKSFSNITLRDVTVRNTILEGVHAFKVDGVHLHNVNAHVSTPQSSNVTRTS